MDERKNIGWWVGVWYLPAPVISAVYFFHLFSLFFAASIRADRMMAFRTFLFVLYIYIYFFF